MKIGKVTKRKSNAINIDYQEDNGESASLIIFPMEILIALQDAQEAHQLRARIAKLENVRIAAQELLNAINNAHDISTILECQDALSAALGKKE